MELLYEKNLLGADVKIQIFRACLAQLKRNERTPTQPFRPLYCKKLARIATQLHPHSSDVSDLIHHPLEEVRMEVLEQLGTFTGFQLISLNDFDLV